MNNTRRKNNILHLLFIIIFLLPVVSFDVWSQKKEASKTAENKQTQISLTGDIDKLLPDLSSYTGKTTVDSLLEYASRLKGRPYCRGSKGPSSFDCSGFTYYVFKKIALKLNASSAAQYLQGAHVDKQNIQRGDLVFFKGRNAASSRVGHVGLVSDVLPDGKFKFIHASCSKGICEESSDALYYAKRYVGARRVIDNNTPILDRFD